MEKLKIHANGQWLLQKSNEDKLSGHKHTLGAGSFFYMQPHLPKQIAEYNKEGVNKLMAFQKLFGNDKGQIMYENSVDHDNKGYREVESNSTKASLDNLDSTLDLKRGAQITATSLGHKHHWDSGPHALSLDPKLQNESMGTVLIGTPSHSFKDDQASGYDKKTGERHIYNKQPEGAAPTKHSDIYESWLAPHESEHIGYIRTSKHDNVNDFVRHDDIGVKMAKEAHSRGKKFFAKPEDKPAFEITPKHLT